MPNFENKTAIVSGGLGDIGCAIAVELARGGANVAVGDILNPSAATTLLEQLHNLGVAATYDSVDVTDAAAVDQWVAKAQLELGTPSLIIPNAAIVTVKNILDITAEQWSRELSINLSGAFHLAQAGAKRLVGAQQPGRIVFIGSWAGHAPHQHIPAYCVTKAAMRMLCQTMALELASRKILVNEVAPGYVDAGLSGRFFEQNPAQRELAREKVPIKDLITAAQVAEQVAYLCDPRNLHVTGSVILMDGGLSLLRG